MVNHSSRGQFKTDPDHTYVLGVTARCSCGWAGSVFFMGAKRQSGLPGPREAAAAEWRHHRAECDKAKSGVPK
jgi:hypothetical protein